jgi:hypothetical protein
MEKPDACVCCGHHYAEPMTDPSTGQQKAVSGGFRPSIWLLLFVLLSGFFCMTGCAQDSQPVQAESAAPTSSDPIHKDASADRNRFWQKLHAIDPTNQCVVGVSKGIAENDAKIAVSNEWHEQNFHARLQMAQNMWKIWANIHSPASPDQSLISLVDGNDNSVGGSSAMAGSMVSVDKD